jgi:hypothetical protein
VFGQPAILETHDIGGNPRGWPAVPGKPAVRDYVVVDPASYYFRINSMFEAPAGRYEWLNGILAIGLGHRFAYGPVYSVFEVL